MFRGVVALTTRVTEQSTQTGLVASGTGISIPLAVNSYVEQWTVAQNGAGSTVTFTVAIAPKFFGFLPIGWTAVFVQPLIKFGVRRAF